MQKVMDDILTKYGSSMVLGSGSGKRQVFAMLQNVTSATLRSIEGVASALGEVSRGLYTYIGPVSAAAREGEELTLGEKSYRLRKTELVYYRNEPIYQWGLCVEKGGNDTWGSQS